MMHEKIFNNFKDCITQIEKDFEIDISKEQNKVLFRGEHGVFKTTQPSVKRLIDQYNMDLYVVSPFFDFVDIYSEWYAENYGLEENVAIGFLQHYGFPTDLLDLTPSIDTAYFFSHYENENEKEACIGVFDIETVSKYYEIVDLSTNPYALRPQKQKAWALRHSGGIWDFKSDECDKNFKVYWYKFKKNEEDIIKVNKNRQLIYPLESELAYFFSKDFYSFFQKRNFFDKESSGQKKLIEEKLAKILADLMR